ncbi:MAG TPA: hypothetical protein PLJ27_26510 [Polyangiaceae bacterium]|jgi:hypothetical protein|nr:hypothetical protein [Polyangiaceae bacterium]HQK21043.1 hypothetical protein [Polyangiaceae bacterium]
MNLRNVILERHRGLPFGPENQICLYFQILICKKVISRPPNPTASTLSPMWRNERSVLIPAGQQPLWFWRKGNNPREITGSMILHSSGGTGKGMGART